MTKEKVEPKKVVSIRLADVQIDYLKKMQDELLKRGIKRTISWIIVEMIQYGQKYWEKEYLTRPKKKRIKI